MQINLNGTWKATRHLGQQAKAGKPGYRPAGWVDVPVPGHWQQVPEFAEHTGGLLYRHTFDSTGTLGADETARLRFDGIIYDAKVWFNGVFVGEHEGYFAPEAYDVTHLLRAGENVVMVEVHSPAAEQRGRRRAITGVLSHWDCKPPHLDPGGIWRDVALEIHRGVIPGRLHVQAEPDGAAPSKESATLDPDLPVPATVRFDLELQATGEGNLTWTATVIPETFAGPAVTLSGAQLVRRGLQRVQAAIAVPEARLWWTWDLGQPHLYRLDLEFALDGKPVAHLERLVGIRKVEMHTWLFYLNGRRIFLRGTNYGPPDFRLATVTAEAYHRDLALMREANLNTARIRGHIGKPELYAEASRLGILIWQDFPLEGIYDRTVLAPARIQAARMVEVLGHFPAIGLWCCHGNPGRATDDRPDSLLERSMAFVDRFAAIWNRSTLAPAIREVVRAVDPSRPCIAHPTELGGTDSRSNLGWEAGKLEDLGRLLRLHPERARFVTEFGSQSFPIPDDSRRFVQGEWPNLNWAELKERYMLQASTMEQYVPHTLAQTFDHYVAATQWYQAHQSRYAIEHFRRLKYGPCGGVLQYTFADGAPGITPSLLDYWRKPKAALRAVREAMQPVHIMAEWPPAALKPGERLDLKVFLINDYHRSYAGTWSWRLQRDGDLLESGSQPAELPPDCLLAIAPGVLWAVPAAQPSGNVNLILRLDLHGLAPIVNEYAFSVLPSVGL